MNRITATTGIILGILALAIVLAQGCLSSDFRPGQSLDSDDLSLVSMNIHYIVPSRDLVWWENRRGAVTGVLEELDADFILFQEMETFQRGEEFPQNIQLEWVLDNLSGYRAAAVGDPDSYPGTQPILYRSDRFLPLEQGFFFFSPSPDQIYSGPWEGRWPAYCSWVLFQDNRAQKSFYVYNIHLDAFSSVNRRKGSELIRDRILSRSNLDLPVILAGDFNSLDWFEELGIISQTGLQRAPANSGSFHFGLGFSLYSAIDHFFYSQDFELLESGVYQKPYQGVFPSDHHPIFLRLSHGREEP